MIGWVLSCAALAMFAVHLATIALTLVRPARPVAPTTGGIGRPRITLLRPVVGLDPFDELTLESSFLQDYPDFELIFCAPTEADPAVTFLRRMVAKYPDVATRVLTGQEPRTGNPKLDNLWKGWEAAGADWVCMADSNLLLPPDYLTQLAATWRADTGLVSSPAFGLAPEGFAGRLEAAFLNGNQARLQLASDTLGNGYAQGKTLFWNRAMLNKAGGLAVIGRKLAEDVASTQLVRGLGLRVRLTPRPFPQPLGRRDLKQVWNRQLRWSRVRRDGFPGLFLAEPLNGAFVPTLMMLASGGMGWTALFLAFWFGAEWAMMRRMGWPAGWRDAAILPVRDLMMPALWVATFGSRDINWRGNAMAPPATPPGTGQDQ